MEEHLQTLSPPVGSDDVCMEQVVLAEGRGVAPARVLVLDVPEGIADARRPQGVTDVQRSVREHTAVARLASADVGNEHCPA